MSEPLDLPVGGPASGRIIIPFIPKEKGSNYVANSFIAHTIYGEFKASGTLCGHIDFVGPWIGSYALSPDEAAAIILMLQMSRSDVLGNSNPISDPRLYEGPGE